MHAFRVDYRMIDGLLIAARGAAHGLPHDAAVWWRLCRPVLRSLPIRHPLDDPRIELRDTPTLARALEAARVLIARRALSEPLLRLGGEHWEYWVGVAETLLRASDWRRDALVHVIAWIYADDPPPVPEYERSLFRTYFGPREAA